MMYGDYKNCYDQKIIQALAQVIQLFPTGTQLKLHNGKTIVVVGHNINDPFNPKVTLLFDKNGNLMPKEIIQDVRFIKDITEKENDKEQPPNCDEQLEMPTTA